MIRWAFKLGPICVGVAVARVTEAERIAAEERVATRETSPPAPAEDDTDESEPWEQW